MYQSKKKKISTRVIFVISLLLIMTTFSSTVFATGETVYETSCDKYTDVEIVGTATQYRYRTKEFKTSYNTTESGYTQYASEWETEPYTSGTIDYVQSWPSGFRKSGTPYTTYNKTPKTNSETETVKTTVSTTKNIKYIYWHWCRGSTENLLDDYTRSVNDTKNSEFDTFHAFVDSSKLTLYDGGSSDDAYKYKNPSVCTDSYWWIGKESGKDSLLAVNRCSWKSYKKLFHYYKWSSWSEWSSTPVTATEYLEVETREIPVDKYGIHYSPDLTEIYYVPAELNVNEFYVPDSVTKIHDKAFYNCSNIKSIVLPENLVSIGESAFEGCTSIESITFPKTVTSIGNNAFKDCSYLELVFFAHEDPITIGTDCFAGTAVEKIYVYFLEFKDSWLAYKNSWNGFPLEGYNPPGQSYSNVDENNKDKRGFTYSFDTSNNTATVIAFSGSGEVTVPKRVVKDSVSYNVTAFESNAFSGNTGITCVNLTSLITSIPANAFKNCTALEEIYLEGTLSSLGASAFENCSSLTSFNYLSKLTSIPDYAFKNCTSITTHPDIRSATSIGKGAFENTGIENLTIPKSVKNISESAYKNCKSLNNVTFSSTVNTIGNNAFSGCSSLGCAYFKGNPPSSFGSSVFGGNDNFFVKYSDGNSQWKSQVSNDKWKGYWAYSTKIISKIKNGGLVRPLIIIVKNQENTIMNGAKVTVNGVSYTTGSDGYAYFNMPSSSSTNINIAPKNANHYATYNKSTKINKKNPVLVLQLVAKHSVSGVSFNDKDITGSKYATINNMHSGKSEIIIKAETPLKIKKIELLSGNSVIAKLENKTAGEHTFKVNNSKLAQKKVVSVRMTTVDGKVSKSNLNVYPFAGLEKINDFAFDGDGNVTISLKNSPYSWLKKFKLKLNIGDCLSGLDASYENNAESVKIAINLPEVSREYDAKDIRKILKKKVEKDKDYGSGNVAGGVGGYVELKYNKNTEKLFVGKSVVYMYLQIDYNYNHTFKPTIGPVIIPINVNVDISGRGERTATLTFDIDENGKSFMEMNGVEYEFSLNGDVSGGVGIKAASVGMYGSLGFRLLVPDISLFASGEFGGYVKFFSYNKRARLVGFDDVQLYPISKARMLSTATYSANTLYDVDGLAPIERTYLDTRSEWLSAPVAKSRAAITSSEVALQTSAYEYIEPQIITCGDTVMMMYVDDIATRSIGNMQALVFSVYDPITNTWSNPEVVDDNGTFDENFALYSNDNEIFVVYSEQKKELNDDATIEQMASLSEIAVSKFNFATNKFEKSYRITDDEVYDSGAAISVIDGVPTIVWIKNEDNNLFGLNNKNTIMTSQYVDGSWSEPEIMATGLAAITSLETGEIGSDYCIAVTVDADNDFETTDDHKLLIINADKTVTEVETGADCNSTVKFVEFGGKDIFVWSNGGTLMKMESLASKPIMVSGLEAINIGTDYEWINCDDGKYAITFVSSQDNNDDVYIVNYNGSKWSDAVKVTDTENYIGSYDATFYHGTFLIPFRENAVTFSEDDFTTVADFKVAYSTPCAELIIKDNIFDASNLVVGDSCNMSMDVFNNGMAGAGSVLITMLSPNGEVVMSQTVDKSISSGETVEVDVEFTVPETINEGTYTLIASSTDTINSSNENPYEFELWQSNLVVEVEQLTLDGDNQLIVNLTNEGYVASEGEKLMIAAGIITQDILPLETLDIESIAPGVTDTFIIDLNDDIIFSDTNNGLISVWVETENLDADSSNNYVTTAIINNEIAEHLDEEELTIKPELYPTYAELDLYEIEPISIEILYNNTLSEIEGLVISEDYTVNGSIVTFNESYLMSLNEGKTELEFIFNKGEENETSEMLTIFIKDSSPVAISGSIVIDGNAVCGNTLRVNTESIEPSYAELTYQWMREGKTVSTNLEYTLTADDVGKNIEVFISGTNGFVGELCSDSVTVDKAQGVTLLSPVVDSFDTDYISLVKYDGYEYKCDDGSWTTVTMFNNLAPNKEYTFVARKAETATNYVGSESMAVVCKTLALDFSGTVSIKGKAQRGETLTAVFSGGADVTYTYQWYKNGEPIKNAVQNSYTLAAEDVGSEVYVVLTGIGNCKGTVKSQNLPVTCEHKYEWDVTKQATCNTPGEKVGTCVCGSVSKIVIPVKDHEISTQVLKQPTCEESGLEIINCINCDYTETNNIPAKGHSYKEGICVDCGDKKLENCSCNCHKTGFMGFIWKILRFFYKLFGMNKVCSCGITHY